MEENVQLKWIVVAVLPSRFDNEARLPNLFWTNSNNNNNRNIYGVETSGGENVLLAMKIRTKEEKNWCFVVTSFTHYSIYSP